MNDHRLLKLIIGKHIAGLRKNQKLSQEDLAGLCQIDRSHVSMVEVGRTEPSISKLFDLCEGLNIKPSDFIRLVEMEYAEQNKKD
ncbi:helix-turn-helix domain-containing protein [Cohnella yongneupensis]|uniref:Helix-turn-helix domain-containing protein n=1 Tax=Cohnella yongneupensis TaxID=425006 RepID=A0ABW0R142_9BACL